MKTDQGEETPAESLFVVGRFQPEDAEGIVALFRDVYGEHYPIRLFYDPAAIIAANQEGRYYSIVTHTPSGQVVAVNHLFRSSPFPYLYETGVGLVLRKYRNLGINKQNLGYLYETFLPGMPHIQEVMGDAVCNHLHNQRATKFFKFTETALRVALMPAAAYAKEKSAPGRVASLTVFRCYHTRPHRIFLPEVYESELRWIYGRLDDSRDLCLSDGRIPEGAGTRAGMQMFDFAGVAIISVTTAGADLAARIADLEKRAREKKSVVFQVCLNLTEPWIGEAVETLRKMGYFFGGALPRWFDGDGFLMQKLECPPDFESIMLITDEAHRILDFIKTDQRSVS